MKTTLIITSLLTTVAIAAPLNARACTEGLYNCLDGNTFQQCVVGGTWSVIMSVAPGTTCKTGISANPWLPVDMGTPIIAPSNTPISTSATPAPIITSTSAVVSGEVPAPTTSVNQPPPPPPPAQTPTQTTQASGTTSITTSSASSSTAVLAQPTAPASGGITGDGRYKAIAEWQTFDEMVANSPLGQCSPSWGVADNSPEETKQLINAIKTQSGSIDPRFVLSVVQQESSGCVRVPTTDNGVRNPGLMQDSNGSHTCNEKGVVLNPCPVEQINGMIADGIHGGDNNYSKNMKIALEAGAVDSYAYAVAARIFNSGSFNIKNLNVGFTADNEYVKKVMGRL